MDSRTCGISPKRYSRHSVGISNGLTINHESGNGVVIHGSSPFLHNTHRWLSHPYIQKKVGIVSNLYGTGTQLKNMVYGSCPWRPLNKRYDSRPIMALHEEINDFYNYMSPTPLEHAARRAVIRNIEDVIIELYPSVKIHVIGSFRTGLYLPSSDINLLVIGSWPRFPLNTLKDAITKNGICTESCISVVKHSQGPVLKLKDKLFDFIILIFFNPSSGPQDTELIKEYKAEYPALGKLALVLRQFLYQRDLHDPFFGGVSYNGLLMMIVSFFQLHMRSDAASSHANLGVLLIEFFELYGRKFNYSVVSLNIEKGGSYAPKNQMNIHSKNVHSSILCIDDPLNPFINLGYDSFRFLQIRQAFRLAYATLNMAMKGICDYDVRLQEDILGRVVRVSSTVFNQRQAVRNNFLVMYSAINDLNINSDEC